MAKQVQTKRRKRKSGLILFLILGALVAVVLFMLVRGGDDGEGLLVETEQATARTITETVTAPGVIEPETQVVISSEVSGEIVYLAVQEGAAVQKGQVLVRINPESMLAQLEQANAAILSSKSRVASARASMLKAESEFERLRKLHEKKLVTDQELETVRTQMEVARAEMEASQYQVDQSQASYRQVQESVKKTTIVSPISGVVTKLNVKLGEKVVGAIQMTGTEIMTVADLSVIESVVDVVETDVVGINVGDEAEIEVDALPGESFRAIVSRIANSPKTVGTAGTQDQLTNFEVRLRFLAPDSRFRPGMRTTAIITTERKQGVVSVPIQSVTARREELPEGENGQKPEEGEGEEEEMGTVRDLRLEEGEEPEKKTVVFVVQGDSVVTQEVKTGIRDDRYVEIVSGLSAGTEIVSGSYQAISKDLENGTKIRRKNEREGAADGAKKAEEK